MVGSSSGFNKKVRSGYGFFLVGRIRIKFLLMFGAGLLFLRSDPYPGQLHPDSHSGNRAPRNPRILETNNFGRVLFGTL